MTRIWAGLGVLGGVLLGLALAATYQQRYSKPTEPPSFQRITFPARRCDLGQVCCLGTMLYTALSGMERRLRYLPRSREFENHVHCRFLQPECSAISQSGEMAILLGGQDTGTLARVAFGGGSPREVLENVKAAQIGDRMETRSP